MKLNKAKWTKRIASNVMRFEALKQHKILLYLVLTVMALSLAIWYFHGPEELFGELMGNVFVGVIIAELVLLLLRSIGAAIVDYSEDALKLTSDYKSLMKDYKTGLELSDFYKSLPHLYSIPFERKSIEAKLCSMARKESDCWPDKSKKERTELNKVEFPVIVESSPQEGILLGEVDDRPKNVYQLPINLQVHFDEIMAAHGSSSLFNNIVIRVDDFNTGDGRLHLQTGRSTYFASMVTNRAVDFRFNEGPTVRQMFDYDLHTPPLKDSRLSNHLGFNIVVMTSDDYMVFVERSKKMSIGKRSYGTGVGASLKTRYAILPNQDLVTLAGIEWAVINETLDELRLARKDDKNADPSSSTHERFFDFSLDENYLAFYRDLVEGGKPQLLFWLKLKMTLAELQEKAWITDTKDDKALLSDGSRYVGIKLNDLKQAVILPDGIAAKVTSFKSPKHYSEAKHPELEHRLAFLPMVPSASASVAMYMDAKC